MMNQIQAHPILQHSTEIADICRPLERLNINYFCHVHVDKAGNFSALGKNPDFEKYYLVNQYYNYDIHMARSALPGDFVVWDAVERYGNSAKMHQEANAFGVNHTFTLIERNSDCDNYYHFATDLTNESINQIYVANIDLLKLFILHFKDNVRSSKLLCNAYQSKFNIDQNAEGHLINLNNDNFNHEMQRYLFLQDIKINNRFESFLSKPLSSREIEVLAWQHYGKTSREIASILNVADVTVNKHIANIKQKTNCYTQFQLVNIFLLYFITQKM